ncbi:hypothetical protein Tco_0384755 [Tanacetum coccineum]
MREWGYELTLAGSSLKDNKYPDPTDEDGDIRMGDSTGVLVSLGGEIFLGGKKYRESNIGDSVNTKDGGKTSGGLIGACSGIGGSLASALYGSS